MGQQRRQRHVAREAAHYGHPCEAGGSLEIQACQKRLCFRRAEVCEWATWSAWSECHRGALPVRCGGGERKRSRFSQIRATHLARLGGGRLAEAARAVGVETDAGRDRRLMSQLTAADCKEFQEELESCAEDECSHKKPVDCVWAAWEEWSACPCSGMHERHRRVAAAAVAGGRPCEGPEAEPCISDCGAVPKRDCHFSHWTSWSACPVTCGGGYGKDKGRVRYRVVLQFPQGGGRRCDGGTFELQPLVMDVGSPVPSTNVLSNWTATGVIGVSRRPVRKPVVVAWLVGAARWYNCHSMEAKGVRKTSP
eukprot:symbB.v1.2.002331.t1/scaffold123.1/size315817/16